nr:MAG TPA: hypothetical protein [Caudoviricetes sp.]
MQFLIIIFSFSLSRFIVFPTSSKRSLYHFADISNFLIQSTFHD